MTNVLALTTAAAIAIAASTPSASFAAEPGAAYGGTVGALTLETRGLPTNADQVRSQGGFATAGAVHWTSSPATAATLKRSSF